MGRFLSVFVWGNEARGGFSVFAFNFGRHNHHSLFIPSLQSRHLRCVREGIMVRKRKADDPSTFPVFRVRGEELNVFQVLKRAKYRGAIAKDPDALEEYTFLHWRQIPRGTQRRMLDACHKYVQNAQLLSSSEMPEETTTSDVNPRRSDGDGESSDIVPDGASDRGDHCDTTLNGGEMLTARDPGDELTMMQEDSDDGDAPTLPYYYGVRGGTVANPWDSPTTCCNEVNMCSPSTSPLIEPEDVERSSAMCLSMWDSCAGRDNVVNDSTDEGWDDYDADDEDFDEERSRRMREKRRLRFSESVYDFVCRNSVPKEPFMRWINEMREEQVVFDLEDIPRTWTTIAKPVTVEDKELKNLPILEFKSSSGKFAKFVHFGLVRTLKKHLPHILKQTFPQGDCPPVPHLKIEMWTDGADLCNYGIENNLWPVAITVVAIGSTSNYSGPHRFVPPSARKVLFVSLYLGSHKPSVPEPIFREVVEELKTLDPRPRSDRPAVSAGRPFTVTLIRFLADHPARCFAKNVKGIQSAEMCEKCVNKSKRFVGVSKHSQVIWTIDDLELRTDEKFLQYVDHMKEVRKLNQIESFL